MQPFTARPELSGTFGAVASTHWIASAVGMRLLEDGGNAFDAAAASGFVLQVVEPHLNGPGGDAPILVCRADDPAPTVICGQGVSPAAANLDHFNALGLDLIPATGLLAACVPGAFGAWLTMLRDYGTKSLRDVLEPAIHYANRGHPILGNAVNTIQSVSGLFTEEWTTSAAIFLKKGSAPSAGDLFVNEALGSFYQSVVDHAESTSSNREAQIEAALAYWYEGRVAETIGDFFQNQEIMDVSGRRHRGLMVADDLAGWRPPVESALSVDQGDYRLFKCGVWSQGPSLLQALKILQGHDIEAMDPTGPEFVHLVVETIKLVMADRDAWYGDDPNVPIEHLLSDAYAAERRTQIGANASNSLRPGHIAGQTGRLPTISAPAPGGVSAGGGEPTMAEERRLPAITPAREYITGDTCHVDVVDKWGNMVSATPSGGWLQSSPIVPELGFALGTRMQMFWLQDNLANSLAPRKRPRTTLTPSMAFREGKPYMAFGTPGGDQQEQWSLLFWLQHTIFGKPLQQSIEAPAFHTDHMIASFWPRETKLRRVVLEGRYPEATVKSLLAQGHDIVTGGPWSEGRLSACARDTVAGGTILRAGANPRGMQGYAVVR